MSNPYYSEYYIGLDLETTGLDEHAPDAAVLEVGVMLIHAPTLMVQDTASAPLRFNGHIADDYVHRMHRSSGLLAECAIAELDAERVNGILAQWVQNRSGGRKLPLFGNSVGSFDRRWLARHLPAVLDVVSHRVIDVSSIIAELAAQGYDAPYVDATHRAIPDIERSLAFARWARGKKSL